MQFSSHRKLNCERSRAHTHREHEGFLKVDPGCICNWFYSCWLLSVEKKLLQATLVVRPKNEKKKKAS